MPRWTTTVALLGLAAVRLVAAPVPTEDWRGEAQRCERLGQWDQAADAYLRLLAEDRGAADVRDRLRHCTRRLHQSRRHADPVFREKLASLPTAQALALYSEVLEKLHTHYVDADRVPFEKLYRHGLDELQFALADATFRRGYLAGVEPSALATLADRLREERTKPAADARDARNFARTLAYDAQRLTAIPPTVVLVELACGASNALDEYSLFLTPGQALDDPAAVGSDLAALGLVLAWKDKTLAIDRVVAGSWAAAAGLRDGDRVTHLGRHTIAELSADAANELLKADLTTLGELTVVTPTSSTRVLTLPGYPPSVTDVDMLKDGVGYIRLAQFHRQTSQELESALLRLRAEGMRVLVFDLRGNPGGLFSVAVQVAERFLPSGVIVTTEGRHGSKTYSVTNPMTSLDLPMVVLIDGDTASAAEVVVGALKDQGRATLVGQTTFGKGSIQKLFQLQAGSGLKLTLARFVTPRGRPFAEVGVTPTIEARREGMKDTPLDVATEQASRLLTMK